MYTTITQIALYRYTNIYLYMCICVHIEKQFCKITIKKTINLIFSFCKTIFHSNEIAIIIYSNIL